MTYGQRRAEAGKSVNGTSILADMFDEAGFKVYSWKYLTPQLQRYDVIVWAPDDFGLPDVEVHRVLRRVARVGRGQDTRLHRP